MRRRSTRVAWAMLAAWSASVVALVVLSVANGNFQREPLANTVGLLLAFAAFMGVGALIVANRPGNAIGWVFAAIALLAVTGALAEEYAGYAVRTRPGLLPGGVLAGWYAGWAWYPTVALALVFTPLLFPDGRPPSPPWRLVAWLTGAVTALFAALAAVQPTIELDDGHVVDNPIGVAGLGDPEDSLLSVALGLLVLAAVASLVVRFRRSRGEERLQLKWFTYAGALLPLVLLGDFLPATAGNVLFAVGISFPAGRRRDRDPALPAVRDRPADQPDPGLRAGHRPARRGLRRPGPGPGAAVRRARGADAELGGGRGHPGRGRPVPAGPPPGPAGGRPALQPAPLRRRPDRRGLQRPPARPGRPGHPVGGAAGRGRPDGAADPGVAVAAASRRPGTLTSQAPARRPAAARFLRGL